MMHPVHGYIASYRPAGIALAAVLACLSPARAQEDNPFARPGGAPPPAAAPAASPLDTLELRGVMTLDGSTFVTLVDTSSSRSTVMVLGGTANGVTVSDYQPGDDSVLVQSGANTKRVKMKTAKIVAMATPPPQLQPQQPGAPPAVAAPPMTGPPGAVGDEEVRNRMQRVAEEIRRRREMRREIMERQQQQPQAQQ